MQPHARLCSHLFRVQEVLYNLMHVVHVSAYFNGVSLVRPHVVLCREWLCNSSRRCKISQSIRFGFCHSWCIAD
jgi:hypothetical protein